MEVSFLGFLVFLFCMWGWVRWPKTLGRKTGLCVRSNVHVVNSLLDPVNRIILRVAKPFLSAVSRPFHTRSTTYDSILNCRWVAGGNGHCSSFTFCTFCHIQAGLYPIHLATGGREGDVEDTVACIDLLLEFGADINAQTKVLSKTMMFTRPSAEANIHGPIKGIPRRFLSGWPLWEPKIQAQSFFCKFRLKLFKGFVESGWVFDFLPLRSVTLTVWLFCANFPQLFQLLGQDKRWTCVHWSLID